MQLSSNSSSSPWIDRLSIIGNSARGFVYMVAGAAAMHAGWNTKQTDMDLRGALGVVQDAPQGRAVLIAIAVGFATYALWRLLDGLLDARGRGTSMKGLVKRGASLVVGGIYVSLSFAAYRVSRGGSSGGGGEGPRKWTALLLEQPFGQWLAGIVGCVIIGLGFHRLWKAFRGDFHEFDSKWLRGVARYGYGARGLLFVVAGGFMIAAAVYRSSGQARGLGGALQWVSEQPYGPALVVAVGAGLAMYGLTTAMEAFLLNQRRSGLWR